MPVTKSSTISILDIACVTFRTQRYPGIATSLDSSFFRPESCARQLVIGSRDQFETKFPKRILDEAQTLGGLDYGDWRKTTIYDSGLIAYAYLLATMSGLNAQKLGEHFILGQVRQAWSRYLGENGNSNSPLRRPIQALLADTKFIRTHFLENFHFPTCARAIAKLAGCRPGSKVLIISDLQDKAGLHGNARDLIRALNHDNQYQAASLTLAFTTENAAKLRDAQRVIREDCNSRIIKCPVHFILLRGVLASSRQHDAVIVLTAGQEPIEVELKKELEQPASSTQSLKKAVFFRTSMETSCVDEYMPLPEKTMYDHSDVVRQLGNDRIDLVNMSIRAREACMKMTVIRARGEKPTKELMRLGLDALFTA